MTRHANNLSRLIINVIAIYEDGDQLFIINDCFSEQQIDKIVIYCTDNNLSYSISAIKHDRIYFILKNK